MKCIILVITLFLPSVVFATIETSAYEKYSATNNMTHKTKITWETVDDIHTTCNKLNIQLRGKPYTYTVDACSTWSHNVLGQYECHIITSKTTNNDILGHEVRHCFQGAFH